MPTYMEKLGMSSSTMGGAKRAADIVAALRPPRQRVAGAETALDKLSKDPPGAWSAHLLGWAPGLVGLGVGAYAFKKHWVLGALGGHAIGSNIMPILKGGEERTDAFCRLTVDGAAIAGALWMQEDESDWLKSGLGYVGGSIAGLVATGLFVKSSPARKQYETWRGGGAIRLTGRK